MDLQTLTEETSSDGIIRMLIDLIRDRLPKQSHKDYETISHVIEYITRANVPPQELRRFDRIYKSRQKLNRYFNKGIENVENLRMIQAKKKERLLYNFIEENVRGKIKERNDNGDRHQNSNRLRNNSQPIYTPISGLPK